MKRSLKKQGRRTSLNIRTASEDEIYQEVAALMINNKNRNSASRMEIAEHFNCSLNLATRIMNRLARQGMITRDSKKDTLYWLELRAL